MTLSESTEILEHLRGHRGSANGVSAQTIARRMGRRKSYARTVRDIIASRRSEWARRHDIHVCASPSEGYYIAETVEEIHAYQEHLDGLAAAASEKATHTRADSLSQGIAAAS